MQNSRNHVIRRATGLAMFVMAALCAATGNAIAGDSKTVAEVAAMDNQDRAVFVAIHAGKRKLYLGSRNGVEVAECISKIFDGSKVVDGTLVASKGVIVGMEIISQRAKVPQGANENARELIHGFVDHVARQRCDPNLVIGTSQDYERFRKAFGQ